ncbi:MAG: hypothetical protein Q9221_004940 [Calogaya cf. arnoldii]
MLHSATRGARHRIFETSLRYLWVDALCIVQDDEQHLNLELSQTQRVYAGAAFTIIGADGADANYGLRGFKDLTALRLVQQLPIELAGGIQTTLHRRYPGGLIYGMPENFFDIALTWQPAWAVSRRKVSANPYSELHRQSEHGSRRGTKHKMSAADEVAPLPIGWRRERHHTGNEFHAKTPQKGHQFPRDIPEYCYEHSSFRHESQFHWYTIPVLEPGAQNPVHAQTAFLYLQTGRAYCYVGSLIDEKEDPDLENPRVQLVKVDGQHVGYLQLNTCQISPASNPI